MSENNIQDGEGVIQESFELNIETDASRVHENISLDDPAVLVSEPEETESGPKAVKGAEGDGGTGEKEERQEKEYEKEKVDAEGMPKEHKDTGTGDKRQRPADLEVEVQNGGEKGEIETKKTKVTDKNNSGKKKRQPKTQARAGVQAAETPAKKRGPGRPRKSSGTKKKLDVDEGQKSDVMETAKAIN